MQKIKKILRAVFEKNWELTNQLTNGVDSMGPAPTESQVQKMRDCVNRPSCVMRERSFCVRDCVKTEKMCAWLRENGKSNKFALLRENGENVCVVKWKWKKKYVIAWS